MAKSVSSFNQLVEFIQTFGIDSENAIPIAENFMGNSNIDFDIDGNFPPINVDFSAADKSLKKV
jgi:hypothetical protein